MRESVRDFYKQFGQLIQTKRKEKSLTQSAVADSLSISRATLANLEAGEHRILSHHLLDLVFLLDLDLNEVSTLYRKSKLENKAADTPESFQEVLRRLQSGLSEMRINETQI